MKKVYIQPEMEWMQLAPVMPIAASVPAGDEDERVDGEANEREEWDDYEWDGGKEPAW